MAVCLMQDEFHEHIPVLLNEAVDGLNIIPNGIYADATFGRGNHCKLILSHLNPDGKLFAFDKDQEAIAYGQRIFSGDKRLQLFHSSFTQMPQYMQSLFNQDQQLLNGVLFDLGVSSPQLNDPLRGFSFKHNAKLDMRMDNTSGVTAAEWLNTVSEKSLTEVLWLYGEERFARRIAKIIVSAREQKSIETTHQLADLIASAIPHRLRDKHPAMRSFQAIRIMINHELEELHQGLKQALQLLKIGGRLCVISFHSLEDRIVKQFIKLHSEEPKLPRGLPVKTTHFVPQLQAVVKKIKPSLSEMTKNPRARSAILRVAEKIS